MPYLVSSTPRAEQFEDRLKTIIHSVLAGDSDQREAAAAKTSQDIKPQLHVLPYTSHSPPQNPTSSKPMFSPVKKELPTHLPLPPSGVVGTEKSVVSQVINQQRSTSSQVGVPISYQQSSTLQNTRQETHPLDIDSSIPKDRASSYYQRPHTVGGRPPSGGDLNGMTHRSAGDVICNEIEKSVGLPIISRSQNNTTTRNRDYSRFSPHLNIDATNTTHSHANMAHSSTATTRNPPSFAPGSSSQSSLPLHGGAPSMARMSQGKCYYCHYVTFFPRSNFILPS